MVNYDKYRTLNHTNENLESKTKKFDSNNVESSNNKQQNEVLIDSGLRISEVQHHINNYEKYFLHFVF